MKPRSMGYDEYDVAAGELFIQMPRSFAERVRKYGFDGVRLGKDVFLFGGLSDYVEAR